MNAVERFRPAPDRVRRRRAAFQFCGVVVAGCSAWLILEAGMILVGP